MLDFTWIHAGPSATRILSDQGAEVIKVESNNALSVVGGPASATARGLGQRHNWNAGKLSISLNMKTPQGIDIAKRLVAVSDVVAENFSGRVMPSWGLDYDSITPVNPSIIMLSMSGFGRTGPWKDRVSYGPDPPGLVGVHPVDRISRYRPQRPGQRVQRRRGRDGRSAGGPAGPCFTGLGPDAGSGSMFPSSSPCRRCWKPWCWT